MALLKNTDFESATRELGLDPQQNTAVWLKTGLTFGSPIPNYAVAQFCAREIIVFGVTPAGTIDMASAVIIPIITDANVTISPSISGHKLSMETDRGEVRFVIRKFMIGAGWHKESLANVLSRFSTGS